MKNIVYDENAAVLVRSSRALYSTHVYTAVVHSKTSTVVYYGHITKYCIIYVVGIAHRVKVLSLSLIHI